MPRRCGSQPHKLLLLFTLALLLLLLLLPGLAGDATCPYDLDTASRMIPASCNANATAPFATGCCWFVFAAYMYAASRHSNLTGEAFLAAPSASACSSAFSALLLRDRLVRPSLLSSDTCSLSGDPVRLAAGSHPCQYSTVAAVRSAVDLSSATHLCTSPNLDLSSDQPSCSACQNAVIAAVFALLKATGSKEFVPCGMAATIGIWSSSSPRLHSFQSYVLCMVQILENVGDLSTTNLVPSSPSPSRRGRAPIPGGRNSSRSVKIAAGSAAAAVTSLAAIACLALAIRRRRSKAVTTIDGDWDPAAIGSPLPTEGLYIFTRAELKQATNGYDDRLLLGEGGAGKVYLGKLPSGHNVAIKRIYRERKLCEFFREVEILAKLRHRNLTTMVGYCLGEREHALAYEYMAGGNLAKALHGGYLPWCRRVRVAADVAEGLLYLHEFPEGAVVHRDVKPTNVLLSANDGAGPAKLSDFGVSRMMPSEATHVSTEVRGTMGYVDPDSFHAGHVTEAADVYSFGVVLLELVTGMRAVVPTPSGGAESIVHVARGAMSAAVGKGEVALALGSIVDPMLGPGWDRPSVGAVFETACRCVRPYKEERPTMGEVLAVLKRVLADLETGDAASTPSGEEASEASSDPTSSTTTTRGSTPSVHARSL